MDSPGATHEELERLFSGDRSVVDIIINKYVGVARNLARSKAQHDSEELESAALLALVEFCNECLGTRPDNFNAYLATSIRNAVADEINNRKVVKISRRTRKRKEVPLEQALGTLDKADSEINHLEVNDELEAIVVDDRELGILRLRLLGFTDAEIGAKIGTDYRNVWKIRQAIAKRLIKGKYNVSER